MFISRHIQDYILDIFKNENKPSGLILAGIIGAGKTTLAKEVLKLLKNKYSIFEFTGDDTVFRSEVSKDSKYIFNFIKSRTNKPSLVFVDEVQKSKAIFDAIKYSFDQGEVSFIISGSNPAYLNTLAKKRLQRRSDYLLLTPLSILEILISKNIINSNLLNIFLDILEKPENIKKVYSSAKDLEFNREIESIIEKYFTTGGLALSYFSESKKDSLIEIRKVVDRGFDPMYSDSEELVDIVRVYLATQHSKEFTYQGVSQKTGVRKRDVINKIIQDLTGHAYLLQKKPYISEPTRRSYLSIYSYTDIGIVNYLNPNNNNEMQGFLLEGYIHARLESLRYLIAPKTEIFYYKPYKIGSDDKLKFSTGEVDFIFKKNKTIIPIEVKSRLNFGNIDISNIKDAISKFESPIGIVIYKGVPFYDKNSKILFWPYWLI